MTKILDKISNDIQVGDMVLWASTGLIATVLKVEPQGVTLELPLPIKPAPDGQVAMMPDLLVLKNPLKEQDAQERVNNILKMTKVVRNG
jgi:hypothetical protein